MKTTPKTTSARAPQTPRKPSAKPLRKSRATGSLHPKETQKLIMGAQEAMNYQVAIGSIPAGTDFNTWRRDQVMEAVGLPGISKIGRTHFLTVHAHFLTLAGRDDEAFDALTRSGPKTDHGDPTDTREGCTALVAKIRQVLATHADFPADKLPEGKGHIHAGWLIAATRQRTRKPTLTLDTMADRLDPQTLVGILSHLRNHIAKREGRATDRRSKRTYPKKEDPGEMHEDRADPF